MSKRLKIVTTKTFKTCSFGISTDKIKNNYGQES